MIVDNTNNTNNTNNKEWDCYASVNIPPRELIKMIANFDVKRKRAGYKTNIFNNLLVTPTTTYPDLSLIHI